VAVAVAELAIIEAIVAVVVCLGAFVLAFSKIFDLAIY